MDGAHMVFRHSSNTRQYVQYLQDVTGRPGEPLLMVVGLFLGLCLRELCNGFMTGPLEQNQFVRWKLPVTVLRKPSLTLSDVFGLFLLKGP